METDKKLIIFTFTYRTNNENELTFIATWPGAIIFSLL